MPSRRRTRIGVGTFGVLRQPGAHAREVLRGILSMRAPLTEDAVVGRPRRHVDVEKLYDAYQRTRSVRAAAREMDLSVLGDI